MQQVIRIYKSNAVIQFVALFTLLVLSKIPVFTGKHMGIDGDEAVLGIMSQDLLALQDIPLYFYGQQYGLSIFEVLGISLFESILGPSFFSIKLGALLVWCTGLFALYRLLIHQTNSHRIALLVGLLIIFFPGFYNWSMKARGGYVTAFAFTSILINFLFTTKEWSTKRMLWFGLINAIIFHSQPLWMLIAIPFTLWSFLRQKPFPLSKTFGWLVSTFVFSFLLKLPAYLNNDFWHPEVFTSEPSIGLDQWSAKSWASLSNFFFFSLDFDVPLLTAIAVGFYLIVAVGALIWLSRIRSSIIFPMACSLILLAVVPVFTKTAEARYFLPFNHALLLMIIFGSVDFLRSNHSLPQYKWSLLIIPLLGIVEFSKLPAHWHSPEMNDSVALEELIKELNANDVQYAISADHALHLKIMYFTGQGIKAKYDGYYERTPEIYKEVSQCALDSSCATPVVGLYGMDHFLGKNHDNWFGKDFKRINKRYYVRYHPHLNALRRSGFKFDPE